MGQVIAAGCLMLALAGCAHKTIHEICSDPQTASRFRDYDQCYNEVAQARHDQAIMRSGSYTQVNTAPQKSTYVPGQGNVMPGH